MGNGMMSHQMVSEWYAIIVLVACVVLVTNIVFVLWKKRECLGLLREQHSTLVHSLPMSLGMVSTMAICTVLGAMFTHHPSLAYVLGFMIGILVSGSISLPLYDIAVIDGLVAGAMGGLMGIMLGTMIPVGGVYPITLLLTLLFIGSWTTMRRRLLKMEFLNLEQLDQQKKAN